MRKLINGFKKYWQKNWRHKALVVLVSVVAICLLGMYGVARWYVHSEANKPLQLGTSFVPDYASSLGLDPQQTMDALINIGVKNFRLVSYWSDGEQTKGSYDFSQLDWQFQKAEAAHAKVTLTVGLRQPRWPECHMPDWAAHESPAQWEPQLNAYTTAVINRYKDSPALANYQLENEYFLKGFGICDSIPGAEDRSRLIGELGMLKKLDSSHPVIIGRSNNDVGLPVGQPRPDEFGVSVYLRVWDAHLTHRYLEHPFPSWYYAFMAGMQKILFHRDMAIDELQAEAWTPNGQSIQDTSLAEQNKSLDAKRFQQHIDFAKQTGMKQIQLWGGEYWYYRMVTLHDPSLWNVAKQTFSQN